MKRYPKSIKYKSNHASKLNVFKLLDKKTFYLLYGAFGIKAMESGKLTYKQIEACRRTLRRGLKKKGKLWIRCFPRTQFTKKPIASRMGKGKGKLAYWFCPIKKGQVLFEINATGLSAYRLWLILNKGCSKLPVCAKVISVLY